MNAYQQYSRYTENAKLRLSEDRYSEIGSIVRTMSFDPYKNEKKALNNLQGAIDAEIIPSELLDYKIIAARRHERVQGVINMFRELFKRAVKKAIMEPFEIKDELVPLSEFLQKQYISGDNEISYIFIQSLVEDYNVHDVNVLRKELLAIYLPDLSVEERTIALIPYYFRNRVETILSFYEGHAPLLMNLKNMPAKDDYKERGERIAEREWQKRGIQNMKNFHGYKEHSKPL